MTREELKAAVDAVPYWYHKVALPNDVTTPGWAPIDQSSYQIPADMNGATVLDIGAWDGYWTFEALRRGARMVTAVEDFSDTTGDLTKADRSWRWKSFLLCANALGFDKSRWEGLQNDKGQSIEYYEADIQKANKLCCEYTNIFAFGVLYHLKHPLLALQNMRKLLLPGGTLHIETAILDGCQSAYCEYGYSGNECSFEFYPTNEYGMNTSNWFVGTLRAWSAMVEAAGFVDVESWKLVDDPQSVSEARGFIRAKV